MRLRTATLIIALSGTSLAVLAEPSSPILSRTGSDSSKSAATAAQDTLAEVVVTAQKREEKLQDVPVPVTVVAASSLAQQSQFRLQDYYTQVPGLQLTSNELDGSSSISIRGITSGDFTNPTVGITVDDMPFGSSTVLGGGYLVPDLDPSDLERIEVLRGPQGTLYGASSIGGLVKYVTTDPSTAALSGHLEAGLSDVDHSAQTGYHFSAAINIPLSDTLAIRASGFTRKDPGYIDNVLSGQVDINETEVSGAHLSALWTPSIDFSVKLSALIQDSHVFGSPFVTMGPGIGDLQQSFLPDTGRVDRQFDAYTATIKGKLGTFDLTSVTGYSVSLLTDSYDYTQGVGALTQLFFPTQGTNNADENNTYKLTQEIRASTPIGEHVDWLFGGFYTRELSPYYERYIAEDPSGHVYGQFALFHFWSTYREEAAFTDFTFHLTDRFDVQVGGRESGIRQTFHEIDYGPFVSVIETPGLAPPLVYPSFAVNESAFNYLVTPKFKISEDLMVYARFASGFRPGGINVEGALGGLPDKFAPDTTRNYEIGVKGNTLGHKLSFDASLYYIDWKDIQLQLTSPIGNVYFSNGGRAKSEGVELSVHTAPLSGWRLGGWGSWDEAILTQDLPPNSIVSGVAGDRLPYTSRWSANATVDYEFPLGRFTGSVGESTGYIGQRLGAFVPTETGRQNLPGYVKSDLHADAKTDAWDFELYLNNVTDKRGLLGGGAGTIIPNAFELIQPRTLGLSVSRSF